jgi:hypothetical protein
MVCSLHLSHGEVGAKRIGGLGKLSGGISVIARSESDEAIQFFFWIASLTLAMTNVWGLYPLNPPLQRLDKPVDIFLVIEDVRREAHAR